MYKKKISPKSVFLIVFSILLFLIVYLTLNISNSINNTQISDSAKADTVTCRKERLMWMWNTRRREEWQPVKSSGANVVSIEGNEGRRDSKIMNDDLSYLSSIGMKGIVQLDTIFDLQSIFDTNTQNKVRDYINAIKDNPGIYGYFLADEPDIDFRLSADKVKKLNEIVKSVDAIRPTILNLYTVYNGNLKQYLGTADIEGVDYYAWSGDPRGTWRSSANEFKTFVGRFVDYYKDIQNNNTKENFVFIQAYKWTPGDIQPSTNINYVPTFDDLNGLLAFMKDKSPKLNAHAYYYWSSESKPETTLDMVPELLNTVARISDSWRYDYGQYPVELGCDSPIMNIQNIPSVVVNYSSNSGNVDPTIDRAKLLPTCTRQCESDNDCTSGYKCQEMSSADCNPINGSKQSCIYVGTSGNITCNPTNLQTQCRVQFYTNKSGLSCFKAYNLYDCKLFNNNQIDPRYIIFGGDNNTNPDINSLSCQNNENILYSGTLVEEKEYCANVAGTNYKYNQVDFNFKVKYLVDQDNKITLDKCTSGGIPAGGVCSTKSLQCSKYDMNRDGIIDVFGDFLSFREVFGKIGKYSADFNNDQKVDIYDYISFRSAFYRYTLEKTCNL